MSALRERAARSTNVSAYLAAVTEAQARKQSPKRASAETVPIESILADIEAGVGKYSHKYAKFRRSASSEDLNAIYQRLLIESRRDHLLRLLWVFQWREVPQLHPRLFEFIEQAGDDKELQRAGIGALSQLQSAEVHDFAVKCLSRCLQGPLLDAVELLRKNYQPGDHEVIEQALAYAVDQNSIHGLGLDINSLSRDYPDPELAGCLEWVYERTPCSSCREWAFELLIKRNRASYSLLQECLWDCCYDTSQLAQNALKGR